MAVRTLQVVLGSGATQISPPSANPERQIQLVIIQNNSAAAVRFGDKTVTASSGISLAIGASMTIAPAEQWAMFLSEFWIFGAAAAVIDILYVE